MGCGGNCACAQRRAEAEAQMAAAENVAQSEQHSEDKSCCKDNPEKSCASKEA